MNIEKMIPEGWIVASINRTPWNKYQVELVHTCNGYISVIEDGLNDSLQRAISVAQQENIRKLLEGEK